MRGFDLLEKMNLADLRYISEAGQSTDPQKNMVWFKWIAAACVILVITAGTHLLNVQTPELPMITLPTEDGDGMGFEGYMAHDVTELVNANPWNESMSITTLPVYKNPLQDGEKSGAPSNIDSERMKQILLSLAERLGMDTNQLEIMDDTADEAQMREKYLPSEQTRTPEKILGPTKLMAEQDGIRIEVYMDLSAQITFDPAVPLPEAPLMDGVPSGSYEEMQNAGEWIQTKFSTFMDMENPVMNITGGDYTFEGQQSYRLSFFEGSGSDLEKILQYNFNKIRFCGDEAGNLWMIWVDTPDLTQVMGEYPIITPDEATKQLLQGHYITSCPYEMPGESYLAKMELTYRYSSFDAVYVPYYAFYVELPKEQVGDLKTYGMYYVPAVQEQYIANMPLWDGGIN